MHAILLASSVLSWCLLLTACATGPPPAPPRFSHLSANQQTYMQDRYVCLQQAQQHRSGAFVNQYGGASQSQVVTSRGLFMGCMGAKGYRVDPGGHLVTPPENIVFMVD